MYTILVITALLLSLSIIGLVLLQHGRGADTGAAFGGGASGSSSAHAEAPLSSAGSPPSWSPCSSSTAWRWHGSSKPRRPRKASWDRLPRQRSSAALPSRMPRKSLPSRNLNLDWSRTLPGRFPSKSSAFCDNGRTDADVVELGRHAVLRGQWRKPCRFESGHRHHLNCPTTSKENQKGLIKILITM